MGNTWRVEWPEKKKTATQNGKLSREYQEEERDKSTAWNQPESAPLYTVRTVALLLWDQMKRRCLDTIERYFRSIFNLKNFSWKNWKTTIWGPFVSINKQTVAYTHTTHRGREYLLYIETICHRFSSAIQKRGFAFSLTIDPVFIKAVSDGDEGGHPFEAISKQS